MTVDHRFHHLEAARSALSLLVAPLQYIVDLPFRAGAWSSEQFSSHRRLLEENRALHEAQLEQQVRLQKLAALEQENIRLRELLDASFRLKDHVMTAELLAVDLDPYRQEILVNRGTADGVHVGQPLVDANGIMGQVIRVTRLNATAVLLSDPSHALPVQTNRTGLRTLAVGTGNPNLLELRHIPTSADIQAGDIVSTSGLGGRFPPDYPVATVTKVERVTGEPFALVQARPLAHLDRSREVLLVFTNGGREASQQAQEPEEDIVAAEGEPE